MFLIILPLSRQTTAQSDGRLSFLSTEYLCVVCFLKKYQPPQDSCLRNLSSYLTMIPQSFFSTLYVVVRTLRTRFSAKIFERIRMRIAVLHMRLHTPKPPFSIHEKWNLQFSAFCDKNTICSVSQKSFTHYFVICP